MATCNGIDNISSMNDLSIDNSEKGATSSVVDLGYIEELESDELFRIQYHHYFFQGKVGGKPAWLSFDNLPSPEDLQCGVCWRQMSFLLQIYAPIEGKEDCFHRSLFLFLCRNPDCSLQDSAANFAVFRTQLPRKNDFYREDEPLNSDDGPELPDGTVTPETVTSLCFICGTAGPKRCAQCLKVTYCSKQHQAFHWKLGHKAECSAAATENLKNEKLNEALSTVLFPEYELVTEPEVIKEEKKKEKPEAERLQEYRKYLEQAKEGLENGAKLEKCDDDLESMVKKPDKEFKIFQRRVDQNPEQVIRYDLGGNPLWATSISEANRDVPNCELCGSKRQMEFQLMPHLLTYLGVDQIGKREFS